ncbi:MAG: hypothetical protein M3R02_06720 [Chloroflexota bacterium]|nr:hypothetical protein [Chloroflexota bacterium]
MNQTTTPDHALPVPGHELTDLYCSAALATAGLTVARIDRRNGRAVFVFAPDDRLAGMAEAYYRGSLMIPARGFADAIRGLKAAIHAAPVGAL